MSLFAAASFLLIMAAGPPGFAKPEPSYACRPIPEVSRTVAALNAFWNRSVRLCQSEDPWESAVAYPDDGIVHANRTWLAGVAREYGPPAATGVLAHEWAHMVQPVAFGPRAELQADCLAGAYLKRSGYDESDIERFALISLHSGDDDGGRVGDHGTGRQRHDAVLRGYYRSRDRSLTALVDFCRY